MNDASPVPATGGAHASSDVPALECRGVGRQFAVGKGAFARKQTLRAVQDLTLSVPRGDVLAVVGESGCGKTTLAKMMLGLLPATTGEILLDGVPIDDIDGRKIARNVQPVFQDPYSSLNPRKTLESIISLPMRVAGMGTPDERRQRVEEIMRMVDLPRRLLHSYPSQLSGGQRQRVAIARALVMHPKIVICDEPTSALDVSVQAHILNLLADLREELNLTYVIITHDLAVVEHLAQTVAVMYLGRLVEYGATEAVFADPRHPYTSALLESILTPDPSKDLPEIALGKEFPDPLAPPPGCAFHPRCARAMELCRTTRPDLYHKDGRDVECHLYGEFDP
jgi:peptide/nickel transport system ATP-binding protein